MQPKDFTEDSEVVWKSEPLTGEEVVETALTVRAWMKRAESELSFLGENEARSNAEKLLQELLGWERFQLYMEQNQQVTLELAQKFNRWLSLRKKRIPLEYLTGRAFFREEILEVGPACLIPRPETEMLVETFIRHSGFKADEAFSFLDLGAGSGAIGISLLRYFSRAEGFFSDLSAEAVALAKKNAEGYGLTARAQFFCGDLFQAFEQCPDKKWDAVLSNPPYLSEADLRQITPELRYEPRMALDGGSDGFKFYRQIAAEAGSHLKKGGWLVMEVGLNQAPTVMEWLTDHGMGEVHSYPDDQKIERVVMARQMN